MQPSDLNRQILMHHGALGSTRVEAARETLQRFNPHVEVEIVAENFSEQNAADLVGRADIVFDAAPLFEERVPDEPGMCAARASRSSIVRCTTWRDR